MGDLRDVQRVGFYTILRCIATSTREQKMSQSSDGSVCTFVPLHGPPSPRPPVVLDPPVTSESPPMFSKSFSPLMSRNQSSNSGGSSAPSSRGAGPRWSQAPTSPPVAGMTGVGGAVVLSSGDATSGGRSTVLIASDASTSGWPRSRRAHRRTSGRGRGNKGWVGG